MGAFHHKILRKPLYVHLYSIPCAVQYNDWLNEEVDNMAREGLRTLVVAKKTLSEENYADFEQRYSAAKLSVVNRSAQVGGTFNSYRVGSFIFF